MDAIIQFVTLLFFDKILSKLSKIRVHTAFELDGLRSVQSGSVGPDLPKLILES